MSMKSFVIVGVVIALSIIGIAMADDARKPGEPPPTPVMRVLVDSQNPKNPIQAIAHPQTWKYQVKQIAIVEKGMVDNYLQPSGDDGYELVSTIAVPSSGNPPQMLLIFKKPIANPYTR